MIRMEVRSRCEDGDSKGKVWKDAPHLELKYSVNGGEAAVHSCVVVSVLVYNSFCVGVRVQGCDSFFSPRCGHATIKDFHHNQT